MNTADPAFSTVLARARRCSRYVRNLLYSDASLTPWLHAHYRTPCSAPEMEGWLDAMPGGSDALSCALRQLRRRVMLKLLARDLGGLADLSEVMQTMTALAELALSRAQTSAMRELVEQFGTPVGAEGGAPQQMLVIGMGKLGGGELNVSSDIDLIFVYPEDGETTGARAPSNAGSARALSNYEFFSRLGRRLIGLINEHTADGFVFRVDMRLRPYGDSGPLVTSFAALEEYLVTQGREWERYAWIKARVVSPAELPNGSPAAAELMRLARPFIFRKYFDFGAFSSMRALHAQIRQEVMRRDRTNNIKLGPGGIREIEFIAQVFQLIRGGRDARLCIRPTLEVLQLLRESGYLRAEVVEKLSAAYVFLRNLEHRLQYLDDQQTQDIPENPDDRALLAEGMGYADYPALLEQLDRHRTDVAAQFAEIFSTQQDDAPGPDLWRDSMSVAELSEGLEALGYTAPASLAARLLQIREGVRYRQLQDSSRSRFDNLVTQFIALAALQPNRDQALVRLLSLLESIGRRAAYLAFLVEYPLARQRLADIANASAWACDYLNRHPILLDELLDAREIYRTPNWAALDAALDRQLLECQDIEQQMDALRQFQHSQTFRLLAIDLRGLLPLETLSDHLSDLADLILRHVLLLCWRDLRKKHQQAAQFAIIAYGKLGGRELGYASDLDLIFLYRDAHPDAAEIYARLAKRINAALGSYTAAGRLYETDLRLRPNGASGLMVSSVETFAEYQHQHAWVWEHQALTRARFCAGDAAIGEQFIMIRHEVLRKERDIEMLRREIVMMRQKMHDGHPNPSGLFDIKHDRGGMVDIEFMVQFLVLAHAHAHPELTDNRSNLRLLKQCGALGLISAAQAEAVCDLYRSLRARQHKMRLNNQSPCRVSPEEMDTAPATALWDELLGEMP
jgi:glutamate-ammonia-ligase adenylyltransferase